MARSSRPERLWPGRAKLHEEADPGPYGNFDQRRHTRRLVGSVRAGSESPGCIRVARQRVHPRGAERLAPDRLPLPAADHLEQGQDRPHSDALLVSTRAVLVLAEEKRAL